jgi:hypothetical protein
VATTAAPDQGWESYLAQIQIHGAPPGYPTAAPTETVQSSAAAAAAATAAPQADAPAVQQAAASFFAGFSFPATLSALVPWDGGAVAPSLNAGSVVPVAPVFASEAGQAAAAPSEPISIELPFSHGSLTQVLSTSGELQWVFVPHYGSNWFSDWFFA